MVLSNASDLSSGIYFYQLQTNNLVETKKDDPLKDRKEHANETFLN